MLFLGNPLTNIIVYGPEPIATQPIPVTGTGGPPTPKPKVGWFGEWGLLPRHDPAELEKRIAEQGKDSTPLKALERIHAEREAFERARIEEAARLAREAASAAQRAAEDRARLRREALDKASAQREAEFWSARARIAQGPLFRVLSELQSGNASEHLARQKLANQPKPDLEAQKKQEARRKQEAKNKEYEDGIANIMKEFDDWMKSN